VSSVTDQNKKITKEFFEALSNGSDKYLDFYTDESIIWTAGNNAIGGTRTKEEVVVSLKIFFLHFLPVLLLTLKA
jgi:N-glycosylase/DNA lyase